MMLFHLYIDYKNGGGEGSLTYNMFETYFFS